MDAMRTNAVRALRALGALGAEVTYVKCSFCPACGRRFWKTELQDQRHNRKSRIRNPPQINHLAPGWLETGNAFNQSPAPVFVRRVFKCGPSIQGRARLRG